MLIKHTPDFQLFIVFIIQYHEYTEAFLWKSLTNGMFSQVYKFDQKRNFSKTLVLAVPPCKSIFLVGKRFSACWQ